jgi:PEP-CTERM motif
VTYTTNGIVSTTQSIGANSATSTSTLVNGLTVGQTYTFVAPNVLEIAESVTNTGGTSTDVLFQRDIDWDVFPTEFDENTFAPAIPGTGPVIESTAEGFDNLDPSTPFFGPTCTAGCNVQGDLGGGIKLDLGILAPGQTSTFNFFYGISQLGENVNGLDAQFTAAGASYIVSTQSSENGDYPNLGANSAAIGFGASVPEPSSVALLMTAIAGFGGIAWRRRRKNA